MKTIAVDFDGVIHSYDSGWKGEGVIPDRPVPGAMEFLKEAVQHYHVVIFSVRAANAVGKAAIFQWLYDTLCLEFGEVQGPIIWHSIEVSALKANADVYIDDRAYRFEGFFPTIDELKALRPWNKP